MAFRYLDELLYPPPGDFLYFVTFPSCLQVEIYLLWSVDAEVHEAVILQGLSDGQGDFVYVFVV